MMMEKNLIFHWGSLCLKKNCHTKKGVLSSEFFDTHCILILQEHIDAHATLYARVNICLQLKQYNENFIAKYLPYIIRAELLWNVLFRFVLFCFVWKRKRAREIFITIRLHSGLPKLASD